MMRTGAAAALLLTTLALAGCSLDEMRKEFVAQRYLQQATAHLTQTPRRTLLAESELDRAVALKPDDEELQGQAARLYAMARAWAKAARLFEGLPRLSPEERTMLGYCLMQLGEHERGAAMCREVIAQAEQLRAAGGISRQEWASLLNDAGYLLVDGGGDLEVGMEAVRQAAAAFPLQAAFVDSLGWALLRHGEVLDAAFYLERARRLQSREDPEILYHLGVAYARLGRVGDARRVLQRASELDPGFEEIQKELRRLGRILPPPALALSTTAGG
ncbi:MAG: tetratricopeptide repeat protein [Armatimonadota bacterium]